MYKYWLIPIVNLTAFAELLTFGPPLGFHVGVSLFRGAPPKNGELSFWFPLKSPKKGYPHEKTHPCEFGRVWQVDHSFQLWSQIPPMPSGRVENPRPQDAWQVPVDEALDDGFQLATARR